MQALLIEDRSDVRALVTTYLEMVAVEAHAVASSTEALAWAEQADRAPDLVVCDLVLDEQGGANGLDVLDRLRERWPQLPCVLMSGFFDENQRLEGRTDNATLFLAKPFGFTDFQEAVQRLLRGHRAAL